MWQFLLLSIGFVRAVDDFSISSKTKTGLFSTRLEKWNMWDGADGVTLVVESPQNKGIFFYLFDKYYKSKMGDLHFKGLISAGLKSQSNWLTRWPLGVSQYLFGHYLGRVR